MAKNRYEVKVRHSPKGKGIWATATVTVQADSETNAQNAARKKYPPNLYDSQIVSLKQK